MQPFTLKCQGSGGMEGSAHGTRDQSNISPRDTTGISLSALSQSTMCLKIEPSNVSGGVPVLCLLNFYQWKFVLFLFYTWPIESKSVCDDNNAFILSQQNVSTSNWIITSWNEDEKRGCSKLEKSLPRKKNLFRSSKTTISGQIFKNLQIHLRAVWFSQ